MTREELIKKLEEIATEIDCDLQDLADEIKLKANDLISIRKGLLKKIEELPEADEIK